MSDLLTLYGVADDAERAVLLSLARQANSAGWWHSYSEVLPAWFEPYLGLEQAASVIRSYDVQFIPGLLQTPDYARAVARLADGLSGGRHRPAGRAADAPPAGAAPGEPAAPVGGDR